MIKKKSRRKKYWLLLSMTMWMLTGCGNQQEQEILWNTEVLDEVSAEFADDTEEKTQQATMFIHVCGAVVCPGVYEMPHGSRVYEAIAMAGGMLPEADENYLNLADVLLDGKKIQVLTKEETQKQSNASAVTEDGRVNINTATVKELTQLTGIGDSRAEAIVSYRDENGAFQSVEQIKQVSGIKDGLFQKIKEKITVN